MALGGCERGEEGRLTWFKIDDGFSSHPKVMCVLDSDSPADAIAVWTMAGSYCARHLTDGRITAKQLRRLCADMDHEAGARVLVAAGLWHETDDGYAFHQWTEHQPSRGEVEAKRAKNRERVTRYRERCNALQASAVTGDDSERDAADAETESVTRVTSEPVTHYMGHGNGVTGDVTPDVMRYAGACNATPDPTRPDPTRPVRESSARARATPALVEPKPDRPERPRRRDALDYAGQPAAEAQAALSAACVAAGGVPRTRGGFAAQSAWSQVACDAHELSEALGVPVAVVLAVSARGFVAKRGVTARVEWWHERLSEYYDHGKAGAVRERKPGEMAPVGDFDGDGTSEEAIARMFPLPDERRLA